MATDARDLLDPAVFESPGAEHRPLAFWAWNDALDQAELSAQIAAMHAAGQGGFFIHGRDGLRTPYLSQQWFECVRHAVSEASSREMQAWLYDEFGWPSGSAGGLVAGLEADYRPQALVCLASPTPVAIAEALVRVSARLVNGGLEQALPWAPGDGLDLGRILVQCYPWRAPLGRNGGTTYIDTLRPAAVEAFLQATHERYRAQLGSQLGKNVPGIFTDEPSFGFGRCLPPVAQGWPQAVPWTLDLLERFRERSGYDLTPRLPALFYHAEEASAVRHDFWGTVAALFRERYTRRIAGWCAEHHLALVGHHNGEDSLLDQMRWSGGVMPHYAEYHIPGVDKLGRHTGEVEPGVDVDGGVVTIKQLDSVAAQLGKPAALCETFGCAGQNFALRGRWWLLGWLCTLGVTTTVEHIAHYALRGRRKRDYPPALSYQQPWWPHQRLYADAAARLQYALSRGRRRVDVLVIHPLSSAWVAYVPGAAWPLADLDRALERLSLGLLGMHRDFHYGDETLLAEHGTLRDGALVVGEQRYRVVLLPPLLSLRQTTARLLEQFAGEGGAVLALGAAPRLVDGRAVEGEVLPATTRFLPNEMREAPIGGSEAGPVTPPRLPMLREALDSILPASVCIAGPGAELVWFQERGLADGQELLFLANTREDAAAKVTVRWRGRGALERWDTRTGLAFPVPAHAIDGASAFEMVLEPGDNLLLVRSSADSQAIIPAQPAHVGYIPLVDAWTVDRGSPNALVLDRCFGEIGGEPWPEQNVLVAAARLKALGSGAPFRLTFSFSVGGELTDECWLVAETMAGATLTVNGAPLPGQDGWWVDRAFGRHPIGALLCVGENYVLVEGACAEEDELEALYVTGSFDVAAAPAAPTVTRRGERFAGWHVEPRLQPAVLSPKYLPGTDLVSMGFPHFVGEVTIRTAMELPSLLSSGASVRLSLATLEAAVALVTVNGRPAGTLGWPPYDCDITPLVVPGRNEIALTLVTSLRNLLGPLDKSGGDDIYVSPQSFLMSGVNRYERWLIPLGFAGPQLQIAPPS